MNKRIALVGSSSTGKTTVYELLKSKLTGFDFVNESTRTVANFGFPINEHGTDLTQLAISSFHLKALIGDRNLVLDRSYLDLVVYSETLDLFSSTRDYLEDTWKKVQKEYTHFVYFPIEFDAVDDGVRSVNEGWRRDIDKKFRKRLEGIGDYLTVTGSPMQRVEQILEHIILNNELISVYDYLGTRAGMNLGKDVYNAAKKEGVTVGSKFVMNYRYTGDVKTYPKHFLRTYFKENDE